ncbi:MAG: Hsp20/alpha crystallin family protein [Chloroflexota bacterium]
MRYRKLSYRYAVVMATSRPRPAGEAWHRQSMGIGLGQPAWRPATDVVETANEVIVLVELPGVDHEQLDVLLYEDAVIVEGERRLPAHASGVFHAAEIRQGPVRLELPLPASIDPEQVDARYERGLLEMRLMKRSVNPNTVSIPITTVVDAIPGRRASERRVSPPERDDEDGA